MSRLRLALLAIVLAASLPYLPTIDDYFAQDDFGVVAVLSSKPASYFPRWFVTPWMDDIWGFVPDEVRPFPAVSYQLAAAFGPGSPVANHVVNIAFHAANALLVFGLARVAAGLAPGPAVFAALVFAVLPMQAESVAWITGRVDSMPAFFYFAAFLLFARWRAGGSPALYAWSVAACFLALFTKQNTITLLPALVAYDVMVGRRPPRLSWSWLRPYVPFLLLTAGYLALRQALFGEALREGRLTAEQIGWFLGDLSTHFRRMVFGEAGLKTGIWQAVAAVAAGTAVVAGVALRSDPRGRAVLRVAAFVAFAWTGLAVAPTLVAGYASPRHVYLAASGWALWLGLALEILWQARPVPLVRRIGIVAAAAVLIAYGSQLRDEVRAWGIRTEVSRRAVEDLEREALASPPGTLVIIGVPRRSWDFAVPHALRPPFTSEDLTKRISVVSHSSIHCCPAVLWEPHTRDTMRAWAERPDRPPVVVLHWDADTGALSRLNDRDDPFLRSLVSVLRETPDVSSLDRVILDVTDRYVAGRGPGRTPSPRSGTAGPSTPR